MGERYISDGVRLEMDVDYHIRKFERRKKDRRKALFSYVDPKFDRRKGDRRGTFNKNIEGRLFNKEGNGNDPRLQRNN